MPSRGRRNLFLGLVLLLAVGFAALGVWQVQRLIWKTELIARVEARLDAEPVEAPTVGNAPALTDAYRRVRAEGRWRHDAETRVKAVTALGPGFWIMTPLETSGGLIWVNRGFVPQGLIGWNRPVGQTTVEGLLRLTEPGGGFLRLNQPGQDRWFSRDVEALSKAHLPSSAPVAPYFIDAVASDDPWPQGGLTVVRFSNNHLLYALTWFALCLMCLFAATRLMGLRIWRTARVLRGSRS